MATNDSGTLQEVSEQLLTCDVCFMDFHSQDRCPRILPCHHSFCEQCLARLGEGNSITCPKCRGHHLLRQPLPVDTTRMRLLDLLASDKKKQSSSGQREGKCQQHQRALELYCGACQLPICSSCLLHLHKTHDGVVELETVALEKRKQEQMLPPGLPAQGSGMNSLQDRRTIWRGTLEYQEKPKTAGQQRISRTLTCMVSIGKGEAELNVVTWPQKLVMQLLPQQMLTELNQLFKNSRQVAFHFIQRDYEPVKNLHRIMVSGFAGCVHFPVTTQCGLRVLLLLFSTRRKAFIGFIPNDQGAFVQGLKNVLSQYRARIIPRS